MESVSLQVPSMAITDFINGLSEEQNIAAKTVHNPALILAGAGSGKTRTLMGRFAYLVAPEEMGGLKADPDSVMMVTFTNKAAREMMERIDPLLEELRDINNGVDRGRPWVGTFHGLSLRILKIEADKAGLGRNFSIFDEADSRSLVDDVVDEFGIDPFDKDEFFSDLEKAKARMLDPQYLSALDDKVEEQIASGGPVTPDVVRAKKILNDFQSSNFIKVYARYQQALQEQNAVDFNDLLNRTTRLMMDNEEVRNAWRSKFRHFMVDEVQDINRAQRAWLIAMTGGCEPMEIPRNMEGSDNADASDGMHEVNTYRLRMFPRATMAFVGDDDQSIYAFRGSEIEVMRSLEHHFPGLEKLFLKTSYRCQPSVLAAANGLIGHNTGRFGKDLEPFEGASGYGPVRVKAMYTPEDEIERIAAEAKAYIEAGGDPSEFGVLTRTRNLAKAVAKGLRAHALPVVEGKSSDLRKTVEVRDIMGFVTFLMNSDAEVPLRRIINKPSRGLGATSLRNVTQNARLKNISFLDEVGTILNDRIDVPEEGVPYKPAFIRNMKAFAGMMKSLHTSVSTAEDAQTALLEVMRQTGYLASLYKDAVKSSGLASRAAEAEDMPPGEFLQWLLKNSKDASRRDQAQDTLLEGEDLADRAAQVSEAARRIGNLALLIDEAAGFDSLEAFAQESVLEMSSSQAPSGIQVLTIHASKGLEFDHVRLPFFVEGVMPHANAVKEGAEAIEEERRLFYVAITRARKTVEITRPMQVRRCPFILQDGAKESDFIGELKVAGWNNVRFMKKEDKSFSFNTAPIAPPKPKAEPKPKPVQKSEPLAAQRQRPSRGQDFYYPPEEVSYEDRFAGEDAFAGYDMDRMTSGEDPYAGQDYDPGYDPRDGDYAPAPPVAAEMSGDLFGGDYPDQPQSNASEREEDFIPF